MKQNFLKNMRLWCYDSDTHEAVIVFKDQENFCMLDPMWIVNMSAADINKLFRHDIFYEDSTLNKLYCSNASLVSSFIVVFMPEAPGPQNTKIEDSKIEDQATYKGEFVGAFMCL
ncbi:hypothetical protein Hanom_Chr06g00562911 [Helianthus anomalus]